MNKLSADIFKILIYLFTIEQMSVKMCLISDIIFLIFNFFSTFFLTSRLQTLYTH